MLDCIYLFHEGPSDEIPRGYEVTNGYCNEEYNCVCWIPSELPQCGQKHCNTMENGICLGM